MNINSISFSTENLSKEAYQLNVKFYEQKDVLHSSKKFIFVKKADSADKEIVDLYSLNCGLSTNLSGICGGTTLKCLKQVVPKIDSSWTTILTLDMKDKGKKGYTNEEIAQGEKIVCEFFSGEGKTKSSIKKAKKLLAQKLDFIYREGSLKNKLLNEFGEKESQYLNSEEATQEFCRLTEVFMNAARFGHTQQETVPEQYIHSISTSKPFYPHQKSTIWYPELYKNSIADTVTLFQPIFSTATSPYDPLTGITVLKMKEKA